MKRRHSSAEDTEPHSNLTANGLSWIGPNGELPEIDDHRRLSKPFVFEDDDRRRYRLGVGTMVPYTPKQWQRVVGVLEKERSARKDRPFLWQAQMEVVAAEMRKILAEVAESIKQLKLELEAS